MAQLREIKRRIKSINNTAKVTHAMELVAATKMRKSQQGALASRPYTYSLQEILEAVRTKSQQAHTLLDQKIAKSQLFIIITSDRGLVGGLNINVFREIVKNQNKEVKYLVVGKKGTTLLARSDSDIIASFASDEFAPIDLARTLTKIAIESYAKSEVNLVKIIYPHFQSTIKQVPATIKLLPIELDQENQQSTPVKNNSSNILFEPSADLILDNILPHYILTKIYQALLESKASEFSARMVAMKNATDAANDLTDDLTLTFNQARQEAITKELLDIVTAQSAFQ